MYNVCAEKSASKYRKYKESLVVHGQIIISIIKLYKKEEISQKRLLKDVLRIY